MSKMGWYVKEYLCNAFIDKTLFDETWIKWHRLGQELRPFLLDFVEQTDYVLVIQVCNEPRGFWNYVWSHGIQNNCKAVFLYIVEYNPADVL